MVEEETSNATPARWAGLRGDISLSNQRSEFLHQELRSFSQSFCEWIERRASRLRSDALEIRNTWVLMREISDTSHVP